jgi:hypothetical protein
MTMARSLAVMLFINAVALNLATLRRSGATSVADMLALWSMAMIKRLPEELEPIQLGPVSASRIMATVRSCMMSRMLRLSL